MKSEASETRTRVLFVGWILPHYRFEVYQALRVAEGFHFAFAGGQDSDLVIPTIPLPELGNAYELRNHRFRGLGWQWGVGRAVLRHRARVVIFEGQATNISTWLWAGFLRLLGVRVHFWTIGWHRPDGGLKRRVRLAFYRLADTLLLYGDVGRNFGVEMGYPPQRMAVIGNSSGNRGETVGASDLPREFVDMLPDWENVPVYGAVVGLKEVKKLHQIVEAAHLLRQRGHDAHVLIVGEGPHRATLEDCARRLSVPLSLPGSAYGHDELDAVYRLLDVTVVPSTAGLTVLQSFKSGTPVVTHDDWNEQAPEAEAITDGVTGSFFRRDDMVHLAECMEHWFAVTSNPHSTVRADCVKAATVDWSPEAHAERILMAIDSESSGSGSM